jgi:hypothetical protein
VDRLEEMDIGDGTTPRPTYVNADLMDEQKDKYCGPFQVYIAAQERVVGVVLT